MINNLERGIGIALLAFGVGVVHADITARHGPNFDLFAAKPTAEAPVKVRFLTEPRKTSSEMQMVQAKHLVKVDLKGGPIAKGTNLMAKSDSLQTSGYVGAGRRQRVIAAESP